MFQLCRLLPTASKNVYSAVRYQPVFEFLSTNSKQWQRLTGTAVRMLHQNNERKVEEVRIPVPWGHIAGKNWLPTEDIPVIALHGWRDNAGSFDPLVPLLNFNVFAFDLPGHGLSSHAPFGVHPHYTDAVVVLRYVIRHLGYKKVSFIGHSLGSSIAFTYAALYPDQVDKYVGIECGRARILIKPKELADNMGSTIDSLLTLDEKILNEEPPSYSWNELVERHQKGAFISPTIKSCNILLKRGSKTSATSPDKFQYTWDPRIRLDAFKRFSKETLLACASAIKCEVLNIHAKPGLNIMSDEEYMQSVEAMKNSASKVEVHEVIGKWWGPQHIQPIIALHGWLDNAASFDPLIALMPENLSILALDMPGHGKSTHYPSCGMFHFTEDMVTIRYILRQYGWKDLTLIGHSLGSNYCFIYASLYPDDVKKYVGIDILRPFYVDIDNFIKNGGSDIDKFLDFEKRDIEPPEYTMDHLIEHKYAESRKTINKEACKLLLSRGVYPSQRKPDYYGLTRDVRLKIWFYHSLPLDCLVELTSRVKCEVLSIMFKNGAKFEKPEYFQQTLDILRKNAKRLEYFNMDGFHHEHMNNPKSIVDIILKFLNS